MIGLLPFHDLEGVSNPFHIPITLLPKFPQILALKRTGLASFLLHGGDEGLQFCFEVHAQPLHHGVGPLMSPAERKLAAFLLKLASERFGHHICNDLELVKDVGLTPEESFEIRRAYHTYNGDPEEALNERPDQHYTPDFAMMAYMAHLLERNK